ncbi:cupin domain-containing protein [Deinococcus sp.]|uniref:cupin domain-containing protein n=1 Tax=Deinococcus sp. TaxID=47478 RepID=UPI003B599F7E
MEKRTLSADQPTNAFAAPSAQVGSLHFKAGTVLPPTSHTQDEISFIHSGLMRAVSGGQRYTLRGGDVTFIPAGELHQAEIIEDVTLSYVLLDRSQARP